MVPAEKLPPTCHPSYDAVARAGLPPTSTPCVSANNVISLDPPASQPNASTQPAVQALARATVPSPDIISNLPCLQNAYDQATSRAGYRQIPLSVRGLPSPLKLPKSPLRQVVLPWPAGQQSSSSTSDFLHQVSRKLHSLLIEQTQEQKTESRQDCGRGGPARSHGQPSGQQRGVSASAARDGSTTAGRANGHLQIGATRRPASPPQPIWDKDDELSAYRKSERLKRCKIEQWAREVRQQAHREHQSAQAASDSQSKTAVPKDYEDELVQADESQLPTSITLTYGPAFGATFGDILGGRGTLFGDSGLLPRNEHSAPGGLSNCSYLSPRYGLVDSRQLSKEALQAQDALHAYRQQKDRDLEILASQARFHPAYLAPPYSATGSTTLSIKRNRKRTDQVRLDPVEADIVRQRFILPVVSPRSGHATKQCCTSDPRHRYMARQVHVGAVREARQVHVAEQEGCEHNESIQDPFKRTLHPSPSPTKLSDLWVPFADSENIADKNENDGISQDSWREVSATYAIVADRQLLSLEEGRGGETLRRRKKSQAHAEAVFSSMGQGVAALGNPTECLSPRHLEPESDNPGRGLQPGYYLEDASLEGDDSFLDEILRDDHRDHTVYGIGETRAEDPRYRLESEVVKVLIASTPTGSCDPLTEVVSMEVDLVEPPSDRRVDLSKAHTHRCRSQLQGPSPPRGRLNSQHTFSTVVTQCVDGSESDSRSAGKSASSPPDAHLANAAISIPRLPEQCADAERYRPQALIRKDESALLEESYERSAHPPVPASFSGSNDTIPWTDSGEQTYTRIWHTIQNMIASSGKDSGSSMISTSYGQPASLRSNMVYPSHTPRDGKCRLTKAQPSLNTSEIPSLDLEDRGADRQTLQNSATAEESVRDTVHSLPPCSGPAGEGSGGGDRHRLLSHQSSLGRLNTVMISLPHSDSTAEAYSACKSRIPILMSPPVCSTRQQIVSVPSLTLSNKLMAHSVLHDYDKVEEVENSPPLYGNGDSQRHQQRLPVPMVPYSSWSLSSMMQPPPPRPPLLQPTLRRRPSLRRLASRHSLKPVRSDVSMRTADSYHHEAGCGSMTTTTTACLTGGEARGVCGVDLDLDGIVEEASKSSEDVVMRTVSADSSREEASGVDEGRRYLCTVGEGRVGDTSHVPPNNRDGGAVVVERTSTENLEPRAAAAAAAAAAVHGGEERKRSWRKSWRKESGRLL